MNGVSGLIGKLSQSKHILGYTSDETVMLDLDGMSRARAPPPRVVYWEGSHDREICDYLLLRALILDVSSDLNM